MDVGDELRELASLTLLSQSRSVDLQAERYLSFLGRETTKKGAEPRAKVPVPVGPKARFPVRGGGPVPTDKSIRPAQEVTTGFEFQHEPLDCDPTQVTNVLHELSVRHRRPDIGLSYNEVRQIIPTGLEGVSYRRLVDRLKKRLSPLGYEPRCVFGSQESRWDIAKSVLRSENCSFPVLGVSPSYWSIVSTDIENAMEPDHAVVLLSIADGRAKLFDCFLQMLARTGRCRIIQGRGSVAVADAIVNVSESQLTELWDGAHTPRHLFWIRRIPQAGRPSHLEDWAP